MVGVIYHDNVLSRLPAHILDLCVMYILLYVGIRNQGAREIAVRVHFQSSVWHCGWAIPININRNLANKSPLTSRKFTLNVPYISIR